MDQIINFEISNYCNLKCPLCPREFSGNEIDSTQLDYDTFEKIVFTNFLYFKKCICKFCGESGDPLMHPKINQFIKLGSKYFTEVLIFTNGSVRKSEWYNDQMSKYDNLHFHFGIDGMTNEINNLYRNGSDIDKVFDNLESAAKVSSLRVKWDYTVFKWNEHQVDSARQKAKLLDVYINVRPNGKTGHPSIEKAIYEQAKNFL